MQKEQTVAIDSSYRYKDDWTDLVWRAYQRKENLIVAVGESKIMCQVASFRVEEQKPGLYRTAVVLRRLEDDGRKQAAG